MTPFRTLLGIALSGVIALFASFAAAPAAHAEIEKFKNTGRSGTLVNWWPKLPVPAGWEQDIEASIEENVNALAPAGQTFGEAETVIFANAIEKRRLVPTPSIDALIREELRTITASTPGIAVNEMAPIRTADGKVLRSFLFVPADGGRWERVSYAEEAGFFVVFTVSARNQSGYKAVAPLYEQLLANYR